MSDWQLNAKALRISLVVSRVPRPISESQPDVVTIFYRPQIGDSAFAIERSPFTDFRLYSVDEHVGKSATQIRWGDNDKKLVASDADTYDKWAQALASATEQLTPLSRHPLMLRAPFLTS